MNSDQRLQAALTALRKSEDEKRAILLGLQDLVTVFYLDPQLRIIWTNRDLVKELNKIRDEAMLPDYCYGIMHGQTEPCSDCTAVMALEKGKLQEKDTRLDDGRFFIRRGNPIYDSTGAILGVVQIALNVTKHKQTEEGLKSTYEFLHSLLEHSPTPIFVSSRDGRIEMVNRAWEKIVGLKREQVINQFLRDIFPAKVAERFERMNKKVLQSGVSTEIEESIDFSTGSYDFYTVKFPIQDASGQRVAVGSISVDITARKHMEQELTQREAELMRKSEQLGEMNTALRVLLRQRDEDQKELEERMVSNVNELVLPYVHKLKGMHLNESQMSYLEIVEMHLKDIVTPFLRQMVTEYPRMTAKELQVATLVKEGKTNKEIAELMNVSVNAVEIHRYNLRNKLGLQNKKINLRSYLLSLKKLSP